MASSIQLLRSTNAQERPFPNNLLEGQPALNLNSTEPGLFFKATDGSLVKVGPAAITADGSPPNSSATGLAGNTAGEMWLDKSVVPPVLKIYDGTDWVDAGSGGGGSNVSLLRWTRTAIGGETTLSGLDDSGQQLAYTPGLEQVFRNGALLERGVDYVGNNGTAFSNLSPLTVGEVVIVLAYSPLSIANLDASDISFFQGGSGSISRTVEDKLRDAVALKDFDDTIGDITLALTQASATAGDRPVHIDSDVSYSLTSDVRAKVEDNGSIDLSGKYRIIDPGSVLPNLYKNEAFRDVAPQPNYAPWPKCPRASDISLRVFYARNSFAFSQVFRGDGTLTSLSVPVNPSVSKQAITDFGATRIDWFYASATNTVDPNYNGIALGPGTPPPPGSLKQYSTLGKSFIDDVTLNYSIPITGAINTRTRSDTPELAWFERNGIFFGNPYNPGFISQNVAWAEGAIEAGCHAVVIDEVGAVDISRGEAKYFDEMRLNMISQLSLAPSVTPGGWAKKMAPSIVAFQAKSYYVNNTTYEWHSLEIENQSAGSRTLLSPEFIFEVTNNDGGLEGYKKRFAMAYANGQIMQVPHDLYLWNEFYRLYATPAEFANYTAFVSASALDLNGYEGVCISGKDADKEYRWEQNPVRVTSNPSNLQLSLVTRAKQGSNKTVIHLINEGYDGSPISGPIQFSVKKTALGGSTFNINAFKPKAPGATFGRDVVTLSFTQTSSEVEITLNEPPNPWILVAITST